MAIAEDAPMLCPDHGKHWGCSDALPWSWQALRMLWCSALIMASAEDALMLCPDHGKHWGCSDALPWSWPSWLRIQEALWHPLRSSQPSHAGTVLGGANLTLTPAGTGRGAAHQLCVYPACRRWDGRGLCYRCSGQVQCDMFRTMSHMHDPITYEVMGSCDMCKWLAVGWW